MNEVNAKQFVVVPVNTTSSSGQGANISETATVTKDVPVVDVREHSRKVAESAEMTLNRVNKAIVHMTEIVQSEQRNLDFSVDEASGLTVVKVMDRNTGELIRQMPRQAFLDLAESARKFEDVHLISTYG